MELTLLFNVASRVNHDASFLLSEFIGQLGYAALPRGLLRRLLAAARLTVYPVVKLRGWISNAAAPQAAPRRPLLSAAPSLERLHAQSGYGFYFFFCVTDFLAAHLASLGFQLGPKAIFAEPDSVPLGKLGRSPIFGVAAILD